MKLAAIGCAVAWVFAAAVPARAQTRAEFERAVSVRGETPGCVTARALRGRIAQYLASGTRPEALAVEVDLEQRPPGFRVLSGGEVVAERRFDRLPGDCAGQRDAIAVAIAVAIEHALPPREKVLQLSAATGTAEAGAVQVGAGEEKVAAVREAEVQRAPEVSGDEDEDVHEDEDGHEDPHAHAHGNEHEDKHAHGDEHEDKHAHGNEHEDVNGDEGERWRRAQERWMVYGGARLLNEALPGANGVVTFTLGAEYALLPEFRVSLGGIASTQREVELADGLATTQLFGGQASGCWNTPLYFVLLQGCAGITVAYVGAEGVDGFDEMQGAGMEWVAGHLRAGLEVPSTGTLALRAIAEAHLNFVRPEMAVEPHSNADNSRDVEGFGGSVGIELLLRID